YKIWCIVMEAVFTRRNVRDVVLGIAPRPLTVSQEHKRVHHSRGFATKMALPRKFMSMRMNDDQKMASWIGDVRNVAFRLKQAGITV
ncbi:hypothetical protein B0H19DRAFT_881375, partial [Mycena capillaripes]